MAELYREIKKDAELNFRLEARLSELEMEGGRIHPHAYRNHVNMSFDNLARDKENISYYSSKAALEACVKLALRNADNRINIKNFMISHRTDLSLYVKINKVIGSVYTKDDEVIETNIALVALCKDWKTGKLFVKNSYPVLAKEVM